MTTTTTTPTNTWEGASIDVVGVEKALGQLWKQVGQGEASSGRPAPARTSVLNLVVYVSHKDKAGPVIDAIAGLIERHPSRTIVVVADPDAPTSSLDAVVTTNCTKTDSARGSFCWEQVTLTAHGETAAHAPSIIIPLLLPDLPTYLWWTDDVPFGSDLFTRMAALCDRIIVDSARLARPIDGLSKLATLSHATDADHGVSDFHWVRLTPWRNLTAQFFDKADLRPCVSRIDSVHVSYARPDGQGGPAQALLVAGWLVACLGWTPHPQGARLHGGTMRLEAARGGTVVPIDITPDEKPGVEGGDVLSLTLTATLRDVRAVFTVERLPEDHEASTTYTLDGAPSVSHHVRMTTRDKSELLNEELEVFRHDRIYENAIDAVAALCERVIAEE
jgi:glucose-6-phosphate dehydrogenase assembly protein OpcA